VKIVGEVLGDADEIQLRKPVGAQKAARDAVTRERKLDELLEREAGPNGRSELVLSTVGSVLPVEVLEMIRAAGARSHVSWKASGK
jgi:hypothetical protein